MSHTSIYCSINYNCTRTIFNVGRYLVVISLIWPYRVIFNIFSIFRYSFIIVRYFRVIDKDSLIQVFRIIFSIRREWKYRTISSVDQCTNTERWFSTVDTYSFTDCSNLSTLMSHTSIYCSINYNCTRTIFNVGRYLVVISLIWPYRVIFNIFSIFRYSFIIVRYFRVIDKDSLIRVFRIIFSIRREWKYGVISSVDQCTNTERWFSTVYTHCFTDCSNLSTLKDQISIYINSSIDSKSINRKSPSISQ